MAVSGDAFLRQVLRVRLREARKHTGLGVINFSALIDVQPRTVSRWEDGTRVPGLVELCRIASRCGLSLAWLLYDVDEKREEIGR